MENGNRDSHMGRAGTSRSVSARYLTLLPSIPWRASARGKIAGSLFAALLILARLSFLIGALAGGFQGAKGFVLGSAAGGILGFWIKHSLGIRGRDLTYGFFIRMGQR